jgi:DUF2075 family protein
MPWNYQLKDPSPRKGFNHEKAWAEKPYTIHEVGSTFTIQGFDLNYAGVIIGPSVKYDGSKGNVVFDPSNSQNYLATNKRGGFGDEKSVNEMIRRNLRNELNVLLKRGVHGLYLFAVDEELQKKLQKSVSWSTRR